MPQDLGAPASVGVILLACARAPVPELCEGFSGEARDGCVAQVVSSDEGLSGEEAWAMCRGLSTSRDRCIERAMSKGEPHAPASACSRVDDELLRDSCRLAVADRVSLFAEDIEEVAEACEETGSLREYCLYHVPLKRWRRWNAGADGAAELAALVEAAEARESFALGMGVARATLRGGSRDPWLCEAIAPGRAAQVCRDGVRRGDAKALELGGGLPAD